jgi:hypothetical protein
MAVGSAIEIRSSRIPIFRGVFLVFLPRFFPCSADPSATCPGSHDLQGCARLFRVIVQFVSASCANGHRVSGGDAFVFSRIVRSMTRAGVALFPVRAGVSPPFFSKEIHMSEKTYFDLHISGLGYLNRVREVKPKKGDSFLACDIVALNGSADAPEYRRFDCRVSGKEAQHLVRRCQQAVDAKRKVLIGFKLGDLWTDIFTYAKGKHAGEQGVSLKARLLYIRWIKVDGELVYKAERPEAGAEEVIGAEADARDFTTETPESSDSVPETEAETAFA